nr:DUF6461 domain-containing protein [Planomonospora venezuelensis]
MDRFRSPTRRRTAGRGIDTAPGFFSRFFRGHRDRTLLVAPGGSRFGIAEEIIMPLSAGTRVVAHSLLEIKALDYFFWIEDGELRFCFVAQDGYPAPRSGGFPCPW